MAHGLRLLLLMFALGLLGTAAPAVAQVRAQVGSLSIESSERSSVQFNANYGLVRQTTASYRVLHKGKPVRLRDADGNSTELSFWKAWTLPDAPRPAILAANRSTYLITEDGGEVRVQVLRGAYHDSASWQWLDADGKVGERQRVYIRDQVEGPHELRGGQMLAVSARVLLDVRTLRVQALDTESDFETLKKNGGYAVNGDQGVLMYSAAAGQVALLARNQAGTIAVGSTSNPPLGMLVVEQGTNAQYAVPFDSTAMRLAEADVDATPAWAAAHFEWRADAQGRLRLQARKLKQSTPWQGRIRDPQREANFTRETTFVLMPVNKRMAGALAALIEREFAGKPLPPLPDEPELSARLQVDGLPLSLRYFDDDSELNRSELHLSASVPVTRTKVNGKWTTGHEPEEVRATNRLVMVLGDKINALLARGALQEHFTVVPKPQ